MPDGVWDSDDVPTNMAKLYGKSYGIDTYGVRDLMQSQYPSSAQNDEGVKFSYLMYQVFVDTFTVEKLNIEGADLGSLTPVNIMPAKEVVPGDFKFTYGLMVDNSKVNTPYSFNSSATHVRVKFGLNTRNFDAYDISSFSYDEMNNLDTATFYANDQWDQVWFQLYRP